MSAVAGDCRETGIESGELISELATSLVTRNFPKLSDDRARGIEEMGLTSTIDVLSVASGFNGITRVANATGIPLDTFVETNTVSMRQEMDIDRFDEDQKLQRFG